MYSFTKIFGFGIRAFALLLLVSITTNTPAAASALTLNEAVQRAIDGNPLVQAAEANRRATDHELRQSQSRLLPNVNLDGDVGGEKIDRPLGFAANVNNTWRTRRQVALTMRQVIFDGWEIANTIYRDAARVDSAALRTLSRSEALALSAIEAFIDVHRQRRVLMVARRNVTRHRRFLRQVQTKKTGGKSGIGEVQQVRERLTAATAAVLQIRQSLADAMSKFNRIVGMPPGHLANPVGPQRLPRSLRAAVDWGTRNNPAILAANADVEAARHARDGSRSTYYPKLSVELKGAHGKDLSGTPGPSTDLSGRLVLNWNLFSGGARSYRTSELAERVAEAMAVRDARMREVIEQIERAFTAIRIGQERVHTLRLQANVSRRVVNTYEEEFQLSKRSLLDLLDAESARFNADIKLIGAKSLHLFAQFRILGATGTLIQYLGASTSNATVADRRETVHRRGGLFSIALPDLSK
jgi:adhesin transport system outer membrane protein